VLSPADLRDFVEVANLTATQLSMCCCPVAPTSIFNTTAEFWMNLQKMYELYLAEKALPGKVKKHVEEHRQLLVSE
jgi:hypothetical protein